MEKIYRINQSKDKITLFNENNQVIIEVHFIAFLNSELKVGMEIGEIELNKLRKLDLYYQIKDFTIQKLNKKLYSANYLKSELSIKFPNVSIINDEVIDDLIKIGYIDDNHLLDKLIESATQKSYSKKRIIKEAQEMQLDNQRVMEALRLYDEVEVIRKRAPSIYNSLLKSKPVARAKQMLYAKLLAQGFSREIIEQGTKELENIQSSDLEKLRLEYKKLYLSYSRKYSNVEISRKLIEALGRKGYNYHDIKKIVSEEENND